jgi:hypothetical protein
LPLPCPCCARANSRNLMRTRVRLHQVAASSSHGQTLIFWTMQNAPGFAACFLHRPQPKHARSPAKVVAVFLCFGTRANIVTIIISFFKLIGFEN